jgi:hypothetical protein
MEGYLYAEPTFMFIDVLKVYSYPINNYFRLTKTFKRANLLLKHYPIQFEALATCEVINKYNCIIKRLIPQTCIITDVAAYNVYVEQGYKKEYIFSLPYFVVLSVNYTDDVMMFKEKLTKQFPNMKQRSFKPFLDYIGRRTDYYLEENNKKIILIQIFEEKHNCIPFFEHNNYKYTTFQTTLYYLFVARQKYVMDYKSYNHNIAKEKILIKETMIQNLIKAKKEYLKKNSKKKMFESGPFQEFVVNCIGDPIPSIRLSKQVLIKRKNKNQPMRYRYSPEAKNNKNFMNMVLKIHLGEEIKN